MKIKPETIFDIIGAMIGVELLTLVLFIFIVFVASVTHPFIDILIGFLVFFPVIIICLLFYIVFLTDYVKLNLDNASQ